MSGAPVRPWRPPSLAVTDAVAGDDALASPLPAATHRDERPIEKESSAASYEDGYARGLEVGREEITKATASLSRVIEGFGGAVVELNAEVESALVALAVEMARRVVLHELSLGPEPLLAALRECLRRVPVPRGRLRLRLHPADREMLATAQQELPRKDIELLDDPTLSRGGCVLEVVESTPVQPDRRWRVREEEPVAQVDARVERRWRQVLAVLFDEDLIQ